MDTESPGFLQLAFAQGDRSVWAATSDGKLEQYCTVTGKLLALIDSGHQDTMACMSLHPTGGYLLSGAFDKLLKVWDVHRCVTSF